MTLTSDNKDRRQEDFASDQLTLREWIDLALAKRQDTSQSLCDCLGLSAPNTMQFWCGIARQLDNEGLMWESWDAWQRAAQLASEDDGEFSAYSIWMEAGKNWYSNAENSALEDFAPALLAFEKAVTLRPHDYRALLSLAIVRIAKGEVRAALELIEQVLQGSPFGRLKWTDVEIHSNAGPSSSEPFSYKEHFDEFAPLENNLIQYIWDWYDLGLAYLHRDYLDEAVNAFAKFIGSSDNPRQAISSVVILLHDADQLPEITVSWAEDKC